MDNLLERKNIKIRALYLSERIDTRVFKKTNPIAATPLTISQDDSGCLVLFKYGVVVFINISSVDEVDFLQKLSAFMVKPLEEHLHTFVDVQGFAGGYVNLAIDVVGITGSVPVTRDRSWADLGGPGRVGQEA